MAAATPAAAPAPAGPITEVDSADTSNIPRPSGGTAAYLRRKAEKRAGRTVSPDTIRREKARARVPETEEEIEYASRRTQASIPLDPQAMFEQEKRGKGVRGASRSGARQPHEPVLLPSDYESRDIQQTDNETANAARRAGEVGKPSRKSGAFYGSRTAGSRLNPALDRIQFYKFDPVLGAAFEALQGGDEAKARSLLRGFSTKLAGVDPRQRKKFFRIFRNVENVPPELLEKDAAFRALFAGIHAKVDPNFGTSPSDSTLKFGSASKAGAKPSGRRVSAVDAALEEVRKKGGSAEAYEAFWTRFPHLRPEGRAGGGAVHGERGSLPVFGRGLKGVKPSDFGTVGDTFTSLYGFPYQLRHVPIKSIKPSHAVVEDRVDEYSGMNAGNRPPIILGPRGIVQDGHHRLETARRSGEKDILAYVFSGKEKDLPPALLKKLGIGGKAGGGPVMKPGGLAARLAARGYHLPENAVKVGETGEEIFVPDQSGHIIDNAGQNLPMWLRRAKEKEKGLGKDLTGYAAGGPLKVVGTGKGGNRFSVGGSFVNAASAAVGDVQRVFVVNWPAGGGGGGFTSQPNAYATAAGPLRFKSESEALKSELGAQMKALLAATEEAKPEKATPETKLSPTERFEARRAARVGSETLTERVGAARSFTSEQQQLIPVRSLSVAVGQIFSTIFGGRGDAITRAKEANALAAKATSLISISKGEEDKLRVALAKRNAADSPEARHKATEAAREQLKVTKLARQDAEVATQQAEKASQAIIGQTGALRNLAAGTVGVVAGTLGFSAALGIAQGALAGTSAVLAPIIERMTGFTGISAQLTSQLADEAKAHGGATQTVVAEAAARAGLSKAAADTISPLLEQRAATEAGNKSLQEGIDLLHTFEDARHRGGQQGVFSTTGGLFGTSLGGTASTQELIKKELGAPETQTDPAQIAERQRALAAQAAGQSTVRGVAQFPLQRNASAIAPTVSVEQALKESKASQNILEDRISFFNDALAKGGEASLKFAANQNDVSEAFASAADKAGLTEIADVARGPNKVVLVDSSGKPVLDPQKLVAAITAVNVGAQTPAPAVLIKQLTERVIPAQKALFRAEGNFQRQSTIPGQFALSELAQPTPGTQGIGLGAGITGDKATRTAAHNYETQVGGAVKFVNEQIAKGKQALMDLVPADLQGEFSGILGDIEATGKAISGIQLGIQQQQTNLAVHEYNNSLRIARRTLADIRDMQAGIKGETRDTLGGLEGQNIALNRQLQLLGFEMAQRQINFKLATAGFVAPGTTPEERAARIEEAKKEAEFAQKQLDIQEKLANNEFKGIQISTTREATDVINQIRLLQEGRSVTINTAAASRALDVLNKKQQQLLALAGSYVEEGAKVITSMMQAASQIQTQTGKGFSLILGETAKAWGIFGTQAASILNALRGSAPNTGKISDSRSEGNQSKVGHASGILGDTLGTTNMTVGEAGRERVAVVKNPHLVPMSSLAGFGGGASGGSTGPLIQMTVIVSGNNVRSAEDLTELAEMMASKVEDRLQRRSNLLVNIRR